VIQNIGPRGEHHVERVLVAAEIGYKHLNAAAGIETSHPVDRLGEVARTAISKLVAVNAGDYGMAGPQSPDGFADVARLFGVQPARLAFADRAEPTMARAYIAEDHKSGRAFSPAFKNIRATRFLADRVEAQVLYQIIHALEAFISA
jgi:hypothetical protein